MSFQAPESVAVRYVTISKFSEVSGYTADEISARIRSGDWHGKYVRAPDGKYLIDTRAVSLQAERDADFAWEVRRKRFKVEAAKADAPTVTCGVYLLMDGDAVAYVGRSTSLKRRIATHRLSGRLFSEARIIACDEHTSVWLEKELIRTLQPAQNLMRYQRHTKAAERTLEGVQ